VTGTTLKNILGVRWGNLETYTLRRDGGGGTSGLLRCSWGNRGAVQERGQRRLIQYPAGLPQRQAGVERAAKPHEIFRYRLNSKGGVRAERLLRQLWLWSHKKSLPVEDIQTPRPPQGPRGPPNTSTHSDKPIWKRALKHR